MSKGLFVTGTGTDVGKTYVAALMVKKLHRAGYRAGYYKAALSGAGTAAESDAGYVRRVSGISQKEETMVSYLYKNPVSPHLAAKMEGNPVELSKVEGDYRKVGERFDYVTLEGSGGIVCPLRWDAGKRILLEDVARELGLGAVLVAHAGLGTIHGTVTAAEYLANHGIAVRGIFFNHYEETVMHRDNRYMIEAMTGLPVLCCVRPEDTELGMAAKDLAALYG